MTSQDDDWDDWDGDESGLCEHDCDDACELEGCFHNHCANCGECGCPGYCDDYQTYNLRPAGDGLPGPGSETSARGETPVPGPGN